MAVESVTVVAPEVRVGPFLLSKGIPLEYRLEPYVPPLYNQYVYYVKAYAPSAPQDL